MAIVLTTILGRDGADCDALHPRKQAASSERNQFENEETQGLEER